MHRRSERGAQRSARDGVGCRAAPDQDVFVQRPCASRVAVRTTLILYGNDYAAADRLLIKRGCATIKASQKPIGDPSLLIDRERLLMGDSWMLIGLMQPDAESGYEQEDTQQQEAR